MMKILHASMWCLRSGLLFLLLLPQAAAAAPLGQESAPTLRLQIGTFAPAAGESLAIPTALTAPDFTTDSTADEQTYFIVQFQGVVQSEWKDEVTALGGELLDYLPDYAFKVRMSPAQAARVDALDEVVWVGPFQPAYKMHPGLKTDGTNLYRVHIEAGADDATLTAALGDIDAEVLSRSEELLLVGADAAQIVAIANIADVAWIENFVLPETHNEYGAGAILGATTVNAGGYNGSTQIVAVADTGLGDGTTAGAHPDIPAGRVKSIFNWPGQAGGCFQSILDDGAIDVDSAHGTHVAGSVLSDGGPGGEGTGTAPAASLVFQATENWAQISVFCQLFGRWPADGYFLTGLPDDLGSLYQQAYSDGARIHSNSWGASLAGEYTVDSANTDGFVWNNPDMAITFSAGNDGIDANQDGVVDNDSIGSPATAKNVITVGASENARQDNFPCDPALSYTSYDDYQPGQTCSSMGGNNWLGTGGDRWGFIAEPLNSDLTAGNQEQMAPFSSRGPTDDGRIKPDIVAPGTWILSTASQQYLEHYGSQTNPQNGEYQYDGWGMPFSRQYKYMGGTSMSNPIAAGAAAVVRDFYEKAHGHSAGAALVKATLINAAVDLLDENNDGSDDNDYPIPNVHEGWGRIDLIAATAGDTQFVDETVALATGESSTVQYGIPATGAPLKVTLAWTDYPGATSAAIQLVNDLDLQVTAPDGTQYLGNNFSNGWSESDSAVVAAGRIQSVDAVTAAVPDRVNNVENVFIQSPAAGNWTVTVSGSNIPNGPQPFALVVSGEFDNTVPVTLGFFRAKYQDGTVSFHWQTLTESQTAGFNLVTYGGGDRLQLNDSLIPSTVIDSVEPVDYTFAATTPADVFYLEEIALDGTASRYGPFELGNTYGATVGPAPGLNTTWELYLPFITGR